jgi:transketolase
VERAGIGHLGAPMGLARPAFLLWDDHLRFDPGDPAWPLRDRFVLSGGHASMLLYSLLHLFGFQLSKAEIESFRQFGSITPGHPEYGDTPGVEVTTGPLGQGFANAVGMALAARMTRARFARQGEGPGHHWIYTLAGDGDLMEGVCYEAASLAGHLGLGNLILLYDDNRVTIDGPTSISFSEDVEARFEAQRWHVQSVDGEDVDGLGRALRAARAQTERPSILITRTTIGFGSPNWAGLSKAHGGPFGAEEVRATKENLGIPLEPEFLVPPEVTDYLAERSRAKRAERAEADRDLAAWRSAHPELSERWEATRGHETPPDLAQRLAEGLDGKPDATRKHSGAVIQRIHELAPFLVGGSADLAGSNNTVIKAAGYLGSAAGEGEDPFSGSNIHFGVREHSMAAITNGIALDGTFRPFCATFMVFSDYMRPSLRLAAMMKLPAVFVFTHDSIFVGEDGPTHQPVEQLDALRVIPGLTVFRPADALETAMAYAWILEHGDGPAMLSLTRQNVPAIERASAFDREEIWRGAYVVAPEADPDVVLMASGSELSLCVDAAKLLANQDIAVRIVSAPCLELFEAQSEDYRRSVLPGPDDDTPVVAVEAGIGETYRRYVGRRGLIHGMTGFGASAPYKDLAEKFGFTPEQLAARVEAHLGR